MKKYSMLIVSCLIMLATALPAQPVLNKDVVAGGGGSASGGNFQVNGTAGQILIGPVAAPLVAADGGFWARGATFDSIAVLPMLPTGIGAATAEVWNDQIYLFGGASTWFGNVIYPHSYRLNASSWTPAGTLPDSSSWGMESVRINDSIHLLDGYRDGAGLNRKYDLSGGGFTSQPPSNNWFHWGSTAETADGKIYLFNPVGRVYEYNPSTNGWTTKTANANLAFSGMRAVSVSDEIYIIGYRNGGFYKYSPATDQWSQLADPPYQVAGCAAEVYNGRIYYVGGSEEGDPGLSNSMYRSVISYNIATDSWTVENLQISSSRVWMASAILNDQFYVIGGFDSLGQAVNIVEAIAPPVVVGIGEEEQLAIPEDYILEQNYPNPFNPSTTIRFALPTASHVQLDIYSMLGQRVKRLVGEAGGMAELRSGWHEVRWNGTNDAGYAAASGVYLYRLRTENFTTTKKLLLMR